MLGEQTNRKREEDFQNRFSQCLVASTYFGREFNNELSVKTITFQVTEDCNLRCTYCYQINKSKKVMSLEDAKKFIDTIIADSYKEDSLVSLKNTRAVIIEFIGGEPLLETKLIREIVNYFEYRCIQEKHPWAINHIFSMISNGVNYFSNETQKLLTETKGRMSFSISLDGNEELHDACRVFSDGRGSYKIAEKACKHYIENYNKNMTTKMTISPYNIEHTYVALKNLFDLGYNYIHANCVYEKGWTINHAKILYSELKKIADHILDNNLENSLGISIFDESRFKPLDKEDNQNYCGSTGHMLCLTPNGVITPCLRFASSSLGDELGDISIGDIHNGLGNVTCHKNNIIDLNSITRRSQSTDECFNCPVATGCGWCTALNYQETGSINKRVTYICEMHRAASLVNVYYWNKVYKKNNEDNIFKMHLPRELALNIIDENEYEMLLELSK